MPGQKACFSATTQTRHPNAVCIQKKMYFCLLLYYLLLCDIRSDKQTSSHKVTNCRYCVLQNLKKCDNWGDNHSRRIVVAAEKNNGSGALVRFALALVTEKYLMTNLNDDAAVVQSCVCCMHRFYLNVLAEVSVVNAPAIWRPKKLNDATKLLQRYEWEVKYVLRNLHTVPLASLA